MTQTELVGSQSFFNFPNGETGDFGYLLQLDAYLFHRFGIA